MISVQGRRRPRQKRPSVAPSVALSVNPSVASSVAPSVAPSIAPPDSSPLSELEISEQPKRLPGLKSPANTSISKYSEDDLQRILKAVMEAQAPVPVPALAPALVPAPVVSEMPRKKLKARFPDVYRGKSHMDCYNFYQQCEDYFATAKAMRPTRILFAMSFLRDRISFRWQQYKQRHDTEISVLVMWDKFKAFFRWSLGNSQAFVDAYWEKIKRDSEY